MSIFLLVSIGSVCAEDVAADADLQSTDVEEVDDLAVEPNNPVVGDTQEKINTTVEAKSPEKVKDDADKNINVTVKDNNSQVLTNLSMKNFTVKDNDTAKSINFTYNNSIITIKEKLAVGEHNLLITYLGNSNYNSSSCILKLKIFTNNTLEVPTSVSVNSTDTTILIPIKLTNGIDDNTGNLNSSNTNITLTNGTNSTVGVTWNISRNTLTIYNIQYCIPANLTITYTEGNRTITKKVAIKYWTQVILEPTVINITEGQNASFIVKVNGTYGILNITKENLTITKTGANNKFNETTGNLTLIGLGKGVYNLTVTFKGNDINSTSFAKILIYVRGAAEINTNGTSVNVNSSKKGEIQIINITNGVDTLDFTDKLNITASYKDGNDTKVIEVKWELVNGTIIRFNLTNGNFTTATLTINYTDGNTSAFKNITLNRIYNAKIEVLNDINEFKDGDFTFKLVDVDDNTTISGKKITMYILYGSIRTGQSTTTNSEGVASFKNANLYVFDQTLTSSPLEVGKYVVELSTDGNVKSTKLTTNLTITKANIKIVIDPFKEYWGTSKKIKITVTYTKSGNPVVGAILKLYMPKTSGGTYYVQTNGSGIGEIGVSGLVSGDYELTVSNNDTKNINEKSAKTTVSILKKPIQINVQVGTMYYNTGSTATVKITDKATGKALAGVYFLVQFDKNSEKTYLFQTNNKGQISFSDSLDVGKHTIVVAGADTRYDGKTVTKSFTVKKASAKIKAPKVTDYYKGVKYFTVKLVNSKNNKIIYAAKINIKIYVSKNKYYNYNGKTGANGQIRLLLDSLKPGKYKVEVSGDDNKNFAAKMVTSKIVIKKAPTKLTPKKLTAKKGAKKYFQVKVTNKKTKKAIKGVKVKIKVYTGKKAKTYKVKTNAKGIAKILTNKLKVGKHKVIVTSANKYCVAKKAKSTIKIKK